jgi:hypothetical protein
MDNQRHLQLIDKAQNYISKIDHREYTPDGKATAMLLYQLDTMIYSLAGINTKVWNDFLKSLKQAKSILRVHSKDENIKMANYVSATATVCTMLQKYIAYLSAPVSSEG